MDFYTKYLKYKYKYLVLKNNMKGGLYINTSLIDKFYLCEFHGSLDLDKTFIIPNNVFVIQSNTCSLTNIQRLIDLFTDTYQYSVNTYIEILENFNLNQQYTIIRPNTEICNIKLYGYLEDFSVLGIFDIKESQNYFENIVFSDNNTDRNIKNKLNLFMRLYKKDYEEDMKKLKETYKFDIVKEDQKIKFDIKMFKGYRSWEQTPI